ncbi:MAG: hypothetical protein J0M12_06950 [Deltaproteobacteria bacterium]|nr:hypothetical protein [Deltaproteobacteria bacterium]
MAVNPHKFDAILVDPDLNSRMRLKQATTAVPAFGTVQQTSTTNEALSRMGGGGEKCDVIFISYRIDQGEITNFIKKAKETKSGQDTAYVLVLKNGADGASIAQNVIGGADGMLFEPYSVDYLYEITNLASRVKKERSTAREKAAISMLVQDLIAQVDQLAYLKSCSMDTSRAFKKMRDSSNFIQTLSPESLQVYYELAVNAFEAAPLPTDISKYKKYGGVSDRIKKRMEKKVVAELEKKGGSGGTPS